jgi:hypothetical protein
MQCYFPPFVLSPATDLQLPFDDLPFVDVCGIIERN